METAQLKSVDWVRARFGGESRDSVYRWARGGKIPAVRVGRRFFFDQDKIEAFIANGGTRREAGRSDRRRGSGESPS